MNHSERATMELSAAGSARRHAMLARLLLRKAHWEGMRAHVAACAPQEGCGLLVGAGERVESVVPMINAAQSASHFRLDAAQQLAAFQEMEDRHLELVGIFHSHPAQTAGISSASDGPSETDVREAAYPAVNVIWSRPQGVWAARGYWIESGRITEVPLFVLAGE